MTRNVTWDRGICLLEHDLWLDPGVVKERAFVSHAHTDHARRHQSALLTEATLGLLPEARRPRSSKVLPIGVPVALGEATVTLHDAGHMLGAAQILFEHGGERLLYTGDLKLRHDHCGARTAIPAADVLVVESTYGRPQFRFPEPAAVIEAIAVWCRRALADGVVPVLLAHAVGKAQELMLALAPYGFHFALEERCVPHAAAYERLGVALPEWTPLDDAVGDRVVVAPPAGKDAIRRIYRYRTALVSGWAEDPGFRQVFGADHAFPYSDHCDFNDLLDVVAMTGADQVYTVHGFTTDLAAQLRRRGVRAYALEQTEQLTLAL